MASAATQEKSEKKAVDKTSASATAIHASDGDNHYFGIGNLRVIVCKDDGIWFAQGLEINYAADGKSLREVKKNFEHGLKATIGLHLQAYGNIDKFLVPASAETWKGLWGEGKHMRFSQFTVHSQESETDMSYLPFSGITYLERESELAA